MASYNGHRLYTPSEIHLALLRPAILQILRAQGYYASTPGTIDCLTELAGQYIYAISKRTAEHANLNNYAFPGIPGIVDVRLALEECGALVPGGDQPPPAKRRRVSHSEGEGEGEEEIVEYVEQEDTRGVDEFIRWAMGRKNQRIRKVAGVVAVPPANAIAAEAEGEDGTVEERPSDYLDALKRKHNKTDQDSKYAGTLLGRSIDHGEVLIEGGPDTTLAGWAARMRAASLRPPDPQAPAKDGHESPPSSGLSSLADEEVEKLNFAP